MFYLKSFVFLLSFRSLDSFKDRAVSIENKVERIKAEISNQEETLEGLLTLIRKSEQRILSTAQHLTNAIVSTGKIETLFQLPLSLIV